MSQRKSSIRKTLPRQKPGSLVRCMATPRLIARSPLLTMRRQASDRAPLRPPVRRDPPLLIEPNVLLAGAMSTYIPYLPTAE